MKRMHLVALALALSVGVIGLTATPTFAVLLKIGDLIVVDSAAMTTGAVYRVTASGGAKTLIASGGDLINPSGLVIDANGQIVVVRSSFPGAVVRINPADGAQTVVATGGFLVNPLNLAQEADGHLIVVDVHAVAGGAAIVRVHPTTGTQTLVSSGGLLSTPIGITIDAAGDLIVADADEAGGVGKVIRVDPATGAQTLITSGGLLVEPYGVAIDFSGQLIVSDISAFGGLLGGLVQVDPLTGAQTEITSGDQFVNPARVALENGGTLVVADFGTPGVSPGKVFRVDPATGAQTVVSSGSPFADPVAIAVVPGADLLQVSVSDPPSSVVRGRSFPVTDTVLNQGIGGADATTTQYYLSLDTIRNAGDKKLTGSRAVGALGPGQSSTAGVTVTVPTTVPLATYHLIACADNLKQEPETSEMNNCLASTATVTVTAPDLVVSALGTPPASASRGSSFSVTDTVTNQGNGPSGPSTNRYYLSLDQVKSTGDKKLTGSRSVPGLGAGLASAGTVRVTIPSSTTLGTYFLIACADDSKVVIEAVETNNCRPSTTQVTITP